jgi:seryl-tRNA synthetase
MPLKIDLFRTVDGVMMLKYNQEKRGKSIELIDEIVAIDNDCRKLQFQFNETNKNINTSQKEIAKLFKEKKKDTDECVNLVEKITGLKKLSTDISVQIDQKGTELQKKLCQVGNIVHESVPIHLNEKDNVTLRTYVKGDQLLYYGKDDKKYHQHELLKMIDGYSPKQGVNLVGHRGYFLKGYAVLLNQALINYGLNFLSQKKKYTPLQPPYFMNKEMMSKTAQLEQFDEELYHVKGGSDDCYLIATSEQPISCYHYGEQLLAKDLPIKYAGMSTCFRKEAGSYGKDVTGLFRIHQFEKVEQFVLTEPEKSWEMLEEMINTSEEFYKSLGLSYRVINIVSGALNNAASKKYDLEAWFPKSENYRELVSASNCTDYQSSVMNTYMGTGDSKKYVHLLNATLCATERTLCCILENYQTDEGIVIPDVLQAFMNGQKIIKYV